MNGAISLFLRQAKSGDTTHAQAEEAARYVGGDEAVRVLREQLEPDECDFCGAVPSRFENLESSSGLRKVGGGDGFSYLACPDCEVA
jgi:hypothetical protein